MNNIGYVLGMGSGIGFLLSFPLALSIFLGAWLDKKLETSPYILITAIFLGLILTVFNLYKIIIPFLEKKSNK
jgi:hypothetical protein